MHRIKGGKVMIIENLRIEELVPYEKNAKLHPKEQIQQIISSIKQFGNNDPIAIGENNVIIEGHGRLIALKEMGYKEVPVIRLGHLNEEQRKAYTLVHNKLTMNTDFDLSVLEEELSDIENINMAEFDFDTSELEGETEVEEDEFDGELPKEPVSKRGEVYQLGRHRLMCGDSTSEKDVSVLMNGKKADMVFTDPPYNIDYKGVSDDRKIKNDKMSDEDFVQFLKDSIPFNETAYVCCSWQYSHLFKRAMEEKGMKPKAMIVWNKVNPAQHLDKYFKQHEIIWYFGEFGGKKTLRGDIWEVKRQKNTVHPTMKPIELISIALKDQEDKKSVYDGFAGSGSTLMACEQVGKDCYTMELDPKYIDVIINRWEEYTGEKAVLLQEA